MAPTPFGLEATRPFFSPSTAGLSAALASPHVVALCPRNPAIALLRQLAPLFCPRFPSIAQLRKTTRARSPQTVPRQQLNLINLLLQRVQYGPTRASQQAASAQAAATRTQSPRFLDKPPVRRAPTSQSARFLDRHQGMAPRQHGPTCPPRQRPRCATTPLGIGPIPGQTPGDGATPTRLDSPTQAMNAASRVPARDRPDSWTGLKERMPPSLEHPAFQMNSCEAQSTLHLGRGQPSAPIPARAARGSVRMGQGEVHPPPRFRRRRLRGRQFQRLQNANAGTFVSADARTKAGAGISASACTNTRLGSDACTNTRVSANTGTKASANSNVGPRAHTNVSTKSSAWLNAGESARPVRADRTDHPLLSHRQLRPRDVALPQGKLPRPGGPDLFGLGVA